MPKDKCASFVSIVLLRVAIAALIFPSTVFAADLQMLILGAEVVDSETGARGHKVLNPSGEVKMTFRTWGLSLNYVGLDGKPASMAVHADFPEPPPMTGTSDIDARNRMMASVIAAGGIMQAGDFLKSIPQEAASEGKVVGLSFDSKNKLGFVVNDYGFKDVTVIIEGKPRITLHQVVLNVLSSVVDRQMAAMAASQALAAQARATQAQGAAAALCKTMFSSTAQ